MPDDTAATFMDNHEGHDLGLRHEGGSLYSATCHDCNEVYRRPLVPPPIYGYVVCRSCGYERAVGAPCGEPCV